MSIQVKLLLPQDYISTATKLVRNAKRRIGLVSLSLFRDLSTSELIGAVMDAAKRGVDVHVAADFVTFVYAQKHRILSPGFLLGGDNRVADQIRRDFRQAGARFTWLGGYNVPIFVGRTHSKWCIIDDTVFAFGGVNTEDIAITKQADYMLEIADPKLANQLWREQIHIEQVDRHLERRYNRTIKTDYGTVLVDDGRLVDSIIYKRTLALAQRAKSAVLVSQYCPSGKLGRVIRNMDSKIYFNQKNLTNDKLNKLLIGSKSLLNRVDNQYHRNRYIHAKFVIFTMPNGQEIAVTGSHNFTTTGSALGTREIALETSDTSIIKQLKQFLHKEIE